jgi:multiple antibiotic resistance protein
MVSTPLLEAFLVLFATMGPLKIGVAFAEDTHGLPRRLRQMIALRVVLIASLIGLASLLLGDLLVEFFHFSLPALDVAAGLLLFVYAVQIVFAEPPQPHAHIEVTPEQGRRMAAFPLAMPILVSPVAVAALITLSAQRGGQLGALLEAVAMLAAIMALDLAVLWVVTLVAGYLNELVWQVAERVVGVLLAALGVEIVLLGLQQLGVLAGAVSH